MTAAYVVVTVLAAAANTYAAALDFSRSEAILDNMTRLVVPHTWLAPLGALKAAGALGLLVGIAAPPIGLAAAVGLVLYFSGAIVTVLRARWWANLPYPATFFLLAAGSLALRLLA